MVEELVDTLPGVVQGRKGKHRFSITLERMEKLGIV